MFERLRFWKRKDAGQSAPETEQSTIMAFVAIDTAELPSPESVSANYGRLFPDAPALGKSFGDGTKLVVPMDNGTMGVIIMMPLPIPWDDLAGRCASAYWWPEATESLESHGAHLILTALGNRGNAIERHVRMTRFTAAVAASTDALGVFWNGKLVHAPKPFQDLASSMSEHDFAPHLWVDMRVEKDQDGSSCFVTDGLPAFGLMDMEIVSRGDSQQLADFGLGIVMYVLKRGAPIKAGETVGRSAQEKIMVSHGPSRSGRGTVMRLGV
jgi:hypothetical protein